MKVLDIQNSQFSVPTMDREELRSPARAALKNPNFPSLCEQKKKWKYSLRPILQSPNFESVGELGKVMS